MRIQMASRGIGLLAVIAVIAGCGKDKTADEYHEQKVQRQVALFQSVSGTYRGALQNAKDGSSMGTIEIDLWPQNTIVSSSDNTTLSSQASLQGRVAIFNGIESNAVIQSAYYFSPDYDTNGVFNGTISVPVSGVSGTTNVQLVVSGSIHGSRFEGTINPTNKVGITGHFTADKNAPLPVDRNAPSKVGGLDSGDILQYSGTFDTPLSQASKTSGADVDPVTAKITIRKAGVTVEENFLNNFMLQKTVSIQVTFSQGPVSIDGISFNSAEMDLQSGRIIAQSSYSGDVNALVSLDCVAVTIPGVIKNQGWNCTYLSNFNGVSHTFTVSPVAQ